MKASQFFVSTLKEAPADAEVTSHKLMTRAGMIKKLGTGIYNYMPMGLRVIRKVENIVREEMNRAGAVELTMPFVQPAELWNESGRFEKMGPELLRLNDRHDRDFVLQPTSEEAITDIARQELRSYKQLPKNFYQIQTKFRDERRPRFGIMRGREFTMKDAYSFDRDQAAAKASYDVMRVAYRAIFDRFGLKYRAVAADSGAIGGDLSEEFQVIADTGEDALIYSTGSEHPANDELDDKGDAKKATVWLLLLRGDHDMNEVKVSKIAGLKDGFRFATVAEIDEHFGCKPGYLGPIGLKKPVKVIADRTVANMSDFVCGANEPDFHFTGANWVRDLPEPDVVADIRNVVAGDPSPDGQGVLAIDRGIEVGHVFVLGTKYSKAMNATFLDETGKPQPFEMGCYGIGVTRIAAAAIEQNHDARGIIWPVALAPFTVVLCPIGYDRSAEVKAAADKLHDELVAVGVDVMLDDRGERPGAMFADWELIGVPQRVVISERGLKEGQLEVQGRREDKASSVALADIVADLRARLAA